MEVKRGDHVRFFPDEDISVIGTVTGVEDGLATVVEAHAFHRIWGGSAGERGSSHTVPTLALEPCPTMYRHICQKFDPTKEG